MSGSFMPFLRRCVSRGLEEAVGTPRGEQEFRKGLCAPVWTGLRECTGDSGKPLLPPRGKRIEPGRSSSGERPPAGGVVQQRRN